MTLSDDFRQISSDAWHAYTASLGGALPGWDCVILTASNEDQAETYREQIRRRLRDGRLPANTHFAVLPDPEGRRVGSGGATLNAIKYVRDRFGMFEGKRILVLHSGGDSRRVPQYSACGKLFSPVPRCLPDGRRSTLFDECIIGMSALPAGFDGGMLVCSGDVLLWFDARQVDFRGAGAAVLSIREDVETGRNHGVFLGNRQGDVARFLHKQTVECLRSSGAVDDCGKVQIDTGAVLLGTGVLQSLYRLIDTPETYAGMVSERTRLSFYADFLYPMAEDSTLEQFYREAPEGDFTEELLHARARIWSVLRRWRMKLIRLSPAAFIHFGTSCELLTLMTKQAADHPGWSFNVRTNSCSAGFAASNSLIAPDAMVGDGSYIEDSCIHPSSVVGTGCILSGATLNGQTIPDESVLHVLKLKDGRFNARLYGVGDNPKKPRLFGRQLSESLWESPLFPVRNTVREAIDAVLGFYHDGFRHCSGDCISLKAGFNMADTAAITAWQEAVSDRVKTERFLEAIDRGELLSSAVQILGGALSRRAERMLLHAAEVQNTADLDGFSRKIRILRALSRLADGGENYAFRCFDAIAQALTDSGKGFFPLEGERSAGSEVAIRLPARVNWGGGWSDTPPYCMENGGNVLNAAILVGGEPPVEAVVRAAPPGTILLESVDSGVRREFTSIRELQSCGNPEDPFALHKAALILCGVIPSAGSASMDQITARLGSGLQLSTHVENIPCGSGLGTSSILACACVKALLEFTGRRATDAEICRAVLSMEQLMTTGGGWQDQVGGLITGIKMASSRRSIDPQIEWEQINLAPTVLAELNDRFCLIYTGRKRIARNLLRAIVGKYIDGDPDVIDALRQIQRLAERMRAELEAGDIDAFARSLTAHWQLSQRIDKSCTNAHIDRIFSSLEDLIDGKMICGAGGGGFLQVILKKGVAREEIARRIDANFRGSGVAVWDCTLI